MNNQENEQGEAFYGEVDGNVSDINKSNRGFDPSGKPRKEESQEAINARRNKRLAALFELAELPVKIIGSEDAPAIIYKGKVLNAYVQNFYLHFTDAPKEGNVIYTLKLAHKQQFDKNKIMECINNYPMRSIHQIILRGTENQLFLAGYNYLDSENSLGRYPVFASYNPKLYFTEEKAQEVVDGLSVDGYDCAVIIAAEN